MTRSLLYICVCLCIGVLIALIGLQADTPIYKVSLADAYKANMACRDAVSVLGRDPDTICNNIIRLADRS